jgi:hypothetical protein
MLSRSYDSRCELVLLVLSATLRLTRVPTVRNAERPVVHYFGAFSPVFAIRNGAELWFRRTGLPS